MLLMEQCWREVYIHFKKLWLNFLFFIDFWDDKKEGVVCEDGKDTLEEKVDKERFFAVCWTTYILCVNIVKQ